jgi:hypothetical protein
MTPTITLTHFLRGPMQVRIAEDATYWTGHREWTDINSDGAIHDDGEFTESREEINRLYAKALNERNQPIADRVREEMAIPDAE